MSDHAKPTLEDAHLTLRLYEIRREPVMRQSRDAINRDFWPKSWEELLAVGDFSHPLNAAFRQVGSYWEMVYGLARHGIADPEYLMENHGEGLVLYAKVLPFLERMRREYSPVAFQNAEWVCRNTAAGQAALERIQKRLETLRKS